MNIIGYLVRTAPDIKLRTAKELLKNKDKFSYFISQIE